MIYFALGGKYVAIAHKEHCVTQLWYKSSLFILDYINNWPSVVSTNFGDNKFSLLVAVINTMFYLYPSMLAVCSFVLFTLRARVVFSNSSLLRISFWFFLDYASSSSESPQSSRHYGSEITHASPTQRSAKEFVDSFSFGTKSRDHGYEVSLGPTHLWTRTCKQSRTSGHRSSLASLNLKTV